MPWKVFEEEGKYCVHKMNDDGSMGENVDCHDSEEEAKKHMKALYANMPMKERMMEYMRGFMSLFDNEPQALELTDLFFTDLSDFEHISTIDGLPVTKEPLTDMRGKKVEIKAEDLPHYITNTIAVLESTRDSSGKIVGLPIDLEGHNHKGGAGWLVGLELDEARKIIRFAINWTEAGIELVKNNVRRFFSASFDPIKKVILGGSMTNTPATRDANYQYMLRPVELSEQLKELDMDNSFTKWKDEILAEVKKLLSGQTPPETKPETEKPVQLTEDDNDKLAELAETRAREMVRVEKRKMHVVEFAASITGGKDGRPFVLPVPAKRITKLLLALPEAQSREVEEILTIATGYYVDMSERGVNAEGYDNRPKLPEYLRESAVEWSNSGKDIKSFFKEIAPELNYGDYNVAEFMKEKE